MSAAPCRDGSGTHFFTIGADRCSICGWNRWPEVVDGAPMTAPEAAPGRVPGVTGWIGKHDDAYLVCGLFRVEVFRTAGDGTTIGWGLYTAGARLAPAGHDSNRSGESRRDAIIRVRILAEEALRTHLTEALAALGGGR